MINYTRFAVLDVLFGCLNSLEVEHFLLASQGFVLPIKIINQYYNAYISRLFILQKKSMEVQAIYISPYRNIKNLFISFSLVINMWIKINPYLTLF